MDSAWLALAQTNVSQLLISAGVDKPRYQLLRLGENALYHIADTDIVVRISRASVSKEHLQGDLDLAQFLNAHGLAAVPPSAHFKAVPYELTSGHVTFWTYVPHRPADARDYGTLGAVLSHIHKMTTWPKSIERRTFDPFVRVDRRLVAAQRSPRASQVREALMRRRDELADSVRVGKDAADGLIHGDAHLGNLLMSAQGPVLTDFEESLVGPREWDLGTIAMSRRRFSTTQADLETFCAAYGEMIEDTGEVALYASVRELTATSWLSQLVDENDRAWEELKLRVHDLATGETERVWKTF